MGGYLGLSGNKVWPYKNILMFAGMLDLKMRAWTFFCISVTLIHYFFIWAFECFLLKNIRIFSIGRHHHFILPLCFVSFVLLSILSRLILLVQRVVYGLYLRFLFFRWFVCDQQTSNGRQSNCLELIQIPVPCIPGCSYFQR